MPGSRDDSRQLLVSLGEFGVGKTWSTYRIHEKTMTLAGRAPFPFSVEVVLEQDRGQSTGHLPTFCLPAGKIDFDALGILLRGPSSSLTWNR
jgi:hypothetical protein